MKCEYFGKCGSCSLYEMNYKEQLEYKVKREKQRFEDITTKEFDVIQSDIQNFRSRAEFRIYKEFDEQNSATLFYAMNDFSKKPLIISSCQIVSLNIKNLMPKLLESIQDDIALSFKLFSIEFLSSSIDDILVTLIYHRKLDDTWSQKAKNLEKKYNIKIIGRSRKQKIILSDDFIKERLHIQNQDYSFIYKEGGFTQPNTKVNTKMISWVLENLEQNSSDLCELYCGGGNFTIPLSSKFNKVLATEISKTSINSAKLNCELNKVENIDFIRMSSQEFTQALNKLRVFNRLKGIDLDSYNFSTVFVDPPRAGCDELTLDLMSNFDKIIYISCNPETLHRDLKILLKTHRVLKIALFDQFAYTQHCECGVILEKN